MACSLSKAVRSFRFSHQKVFPSATSAKRGDSSAKGSLFVIPTIHRALDHVNLRIAMTLSFCILIITEVDR